MEEGYKSHKTRPSSVFKELGKGLKKFFRTKSSKHALLPRAGAADESLSNDGSHRPTVVLIEAKCPASIIGPASHTSEQAKTSAPLSSSPPLPFQARKSRGRGASDAVNPLVKVTREACRDQRLVVPHYQEGLRSDNAGACSEQLQEPHVDAGLEVQALTSLCCVPAKDKALGPVPIVPASSLQSSLASTTLAVVVARVALGPSAHEYSIRAKHTSKELPPACAAAQKLACAKHAPKRAAAAKALRRPPRKAATAANLGAATGSRRRTSAVLQELAAQRAHAEESPSYCQWNNTAAAAAAGSPFTGDTWHSAARQAMPSGLIEPPVTPSSARRGSTGQMFGRQGSGVGKQDVVELFSLLAQSTSHLRGGALSRHGSGVDTGPGTREAVDACGRHAPAAAAPIEGSMAQDLELLQVLLRGRDASPSSRAALPQSATAFAPPGQGMGPQQWPVMSGAQARRMSALLKDGASLAGPGPLSRQTSQADEFYAAHSIASIMGEVSLPARPQLQPPRGLVQDPAVSKTPSAPNLDALVVAGGNVSLRVKPRVRFDLGAPTVGLGADKAGWDTEPVTTNMPAPHPATAALNIRSSPNNPQPKQQLQPHCSNGSGGPGAPTPRALGDSGSLQLPCSPTSHEPPLACAGGGPTPQAQSRSPLSSPRPTSAPGKSVPLPACVRRTQSAFSPRSGRSMSASASQWTSLEFTDAPSEPATGAATITTPAASDITDTHLHLADGQQGVGGGVEEDHASRVRLTPDNPWGGHGSDSEGRLEPVFMNEAAASMLGVATMVELQCLLDLQMGRNPSLMLVLEELVTQLLHGNSQVVTHYVPVFHPHALEPARRAARAQGSGSQLAAPAHPLSALQPAPQLGSFLQVQVQAVRLALSDYQSEPALFVHYRAVTNPCQQPTAVSASLAPCMGRDAACALAGAVPGALLVAAGTSHSTLGCDVPTASQPPPTNNTDAVAPSSQPPHASPPPEQPQPAVPHPPAPLVAPITSDQAVVAAMQAHMQVMYAALSHAPCIVTVLTLDGRVLFQNGRSVDYCGLVYNRAHQVGRSLRHPLHTLRQLFQLDPSALDNLVEVTGARQLWSGLVRMPVCVDLTAQYDAFTWPIPSRGWPIPGPNHHHDDAAGPSTAPVQPQPRAGKARQEGLCEHGQWQRGLLGEIDELGEDPPAAGSQLVVLMPSTGTGGTPTQGSMAQVNGTTSQLSDDTLGSGELVAQLMPSLAQAAYSNNGDSGNGARPCTCRPHIPSTGAAPKAGSVAAADSQAAAGTRGLPASSSLQTASPLTPSALPAPPATAHHMPCRHSHHHSFSSGLHADTSEFLSAPLASPLEGQEACNAGAAHCAGHAASGHQGPGTPAGHAHAHAHAHARGVRASSQAQTPPAPKEPNKGCRRVPQERSSFVADRVCTNSGVARTFTGASSPYCRASLDPQSLMSGGSSTNKLRDNLFSRRSRILAPQARPVHLSDAFVEAEQELAGTQRALRLLQHTMQARGSVAGGTQGLATLPSTPTMRRVSSVTLACNSTHSSFTAAGGGRGAPISDALAAPSASVTSTLYYSTGGLRRVSQAPVGEEVEGGQGLTPHLLSPASPMCTTTPIHRACSSPVLATPCAVRTHPPSGPLEGGVGGVELGDAALAPLSARTPQTGREGGTNDGAPPPVAAWTGLAATADAAATCFSTCSVSNSQLSAGHLRAFTAPLARMHASGQGEGEAPGEGGQDGGTVCDDEEGGGRTVDVEAGGAGFAGPADPGTFLWHDVEAHRVADPLSGMDMLVVTQYDVTPYVAAELEVKRVLDVEHKLLEEIFPRHVLQVMAATASNVDNNTAMFKRQVSELSIGSAPGGLLPPTATPTGDTPSIPHAPPASRGSSSRSTPLPRSVGGSGNVGVRAAGAGTSVSGGSGLRSNSRDRGLGEDAANGDVRQGVTLDGGTSSAHNQARCKGASSSGGQLNLSPNPSNERPSATHPAPPSHSLALRPISTAQVPALLSPGLAARSKANSPSHVNPQTSRAWHSSSGQQGGGAAAAGINNSGRLPLVLHGLPHPPSSNDGRSVRLSPSPATPLPPPIPGMHAMGSSDVQGNMARHHEQVTVLFADIKSFTSMCNEVPVHTVMSFLNALFTLFDALVEVHGVYKVETIGDCYMVAGGLLSRDLDGGNSVSDAPDPHHAHKVVACAQDMLRVARTVAMPGQEGGHVQLRVGVHSGPCMSGVVGRKMPRFCLFGDTVNTASRMESTGLPGALQVSEATWHALGADPTASSLRADPRWRPSGGVAAKGKGVLQTYIWSDVSEGEEGEGEEGEGLAEPQCGGGGEAWF